MNTIIRIAFALTCNLPLVTLAHADSTEVKEVVKNAGLRSDGELVQAKTAPANPALSAPLAQPSTGNQVADQKHKDWINLQSMGGAIQTSSDTIKSDSRVSGDLRTTTKGD